MNSRFLRSFLPVGLALAILATPLATYRAKADASEDANSLTGSWLVKLHFDRPFTADVLALVTFTQEGTFVGSIQGEGAGPGPAETPAYGAWAQTGLTAFAVKAHSITAAADGSLPSLNTLTMQLDAKSNQLSGTWQFRAVDPFGNVTFESGGTLTATRILVAQ